MARCDDCGLEQQERADYERKTTGGYALIEGPVLQRLTKHGWSLVKGKLRCLACELARKAEGKSEMTAEPTPPLRQPTREQKRQIIDMLSVAYDTKAERYKGTDSDITVADAIGGGCMFGWVASIREELFGPDGRNEAAEILMAEIKVWREIADKLSNDVHASLKKFDDAIGKVADLQRRLEALIKASGPRARAAA
jgi:hypothetical protein